MKAAAYTTHGSRNFHSPAGAFGLLFFLCTVILFSASVCSAIPVTLAWDPAPDTDLSAYRIYWSDVSGSYAFGAASPSLAATVPAGTEECILNVDVDGNSTYFVVTAVDIYDNESLPSNEVALAQENWRNYRFSIRFRSDDDDTIGAMFRYRDKYNYYRFSWDAESGYRRLVKRENGVFTVLAEERAPYEIGRTYDLDITADGAAIDVALDGGTVFSVVDQPAYGTVALYTWQNSGSFFADPLVIDLDSGAILLADDFTGGPGPDWKFIDEGSHGGAAKWTVWHNVLRQLSDTYTPTRGKKDVGYLGTYALYFPDPDGDNLADFMETTLNSDPLVSDTDGDGIADGREVLWGTDPTDPFASPEPLGWDDYSVSVDFGSLDDDALGVMFRYQDGDNYYRFSWNREEGYRRLEKRVNGVFTLLATDNQPYDVRSRYNVEILADGMVLTVLINGRTVFLVSDSSIVSGGVALYSHGNKGSCFDNVKVETLADRTVLMGKEKFADGSADGWKTVDDGLAAYPSKWFVKKGLYVQYSDIMTPSEDPSQIAKLGTYSFFLGN